MTAMQFVHKYFVEGIKFSPYSRNYYNVYTFDYTDEFRIAYIVIHNALVLSKRNKTSVSPFCPFWHVERESLSFKEAYKMILRKQRVDRRETV